MFFTKSSVGLNNFNKSIYLDKIHYGKRIPVFLNLVTFQLTVNEIFTENVGLEHERKKMKFQAYFHLEFVITSNLHVKQQTSSAVNNA